VVRVILAAPARPLVLAVSDRGICLHSSSIGVIPTSFPAFDASRSTGSPYGGLGPSVQAQPSVRRVPRLAARMGLRPSCTPPVERRIPGGRCRRTTWRSFVDCSSRCSTGGTARVAGAGDTVAPTTAEPHEVRLWFTGEHSRLPFLATWSASQSVRERYPRSSAQCARAAGGSVSSSAKRRHSPKDPGDSYPRCRTF
jgi:hypothetical protein